MHLRPYRQISSIGNNIFNERIMKRNLKKIIIKCIYSKKSQEDTVEEALKHDVISLIKENIDVYVYLCFLFFYCSGSLKATR